MKRLWTYLLITVGTLSAAASAQAGDAAPVAPAPPAGQPGDAAPADQAGAGSKTVSSTDANAPATPNSEDNFQFDHLSWPYVVYFRRRSDEEAPDQGNCIPKGKELVGRSDVIDGQVKVTPAETIANGSYQSCTVQADLKEDKEIFITAEDAARAFRRGFDFGALVVPFKLQLGKKKDFTGSASIAPYLGYRFPWSDLGVSINPIAFVGASTISVTQNVNGQDTTQSLAAISYGVGITSTVKSSFQLGVVFGFDHVNDSSHYQFNDRPWIAFQLGYSFLR